MIFFKTQKTCCHDHAAKATGKKPESSIELTFSWHAPSHRGAFLTLSH